MGIRGGCVFCSDLPMMPKIFSRLFLVESCGKFSAMTIRHCVSQRGLVLVCRRQMKLTVSISVAKTLLRSTDL